MGDNFLSQLWKLFKENSKSKFKSSFLPHSKFPGLLSNVEYYKQFKSFLSFLFTSVMDDNHPVNCIEGDEQESEKKVWLSC